LIRFQFDRAILRRIIETLLIGALGGAALGLPGFPAGWLSGAILAVSIAAIAGRAVRIPDPLARITFVATGISLGGAVTPETLSGMGAWPASLALLAVGMTMLTAAVAVYLRKVHGWDTISAVLAACPGGLATVLVLAAENGADVRSVAIVQTVRIVLLAVALPASLAALGLAGGPVVLRAGAGAFADLGELAALIGICTLVAVAAQWLRFPGGLMFGAMISSAVLHGAGWISVTLPSWLAIASFVVLGSLTGTRFANTDPRLLRHLAAAALGAFAVGTAVALGGAVVAAALLSLKTGDMIIAYAPGALEAMMILALALNFDPAFVGAHHLARFMLVLIAIPVVIPWLRRRSQSKETGSQPD
jgi:membrane AbrB-like protein